MPTAHFHHLPERIEAGALVVEGDLRLEILAQGTDLLVQPVAVLKRQYYFALEVLPFNHVLPGELVVPGGRHPERLAKQRHGLDVGPKYRQRVEQDVELAVLEVAQQRCGMPSRT